MNGTSASFAQYYIKTLGLALTPILPKTKKPFIDDWNKPGNYYTDAEKAKAYWEEHPSYGMGVVLEPSCIVSFDVDNVEFTRKVFDDIGINYDEVTKDAVRLQGNPEREKYFFRAPADVALELHKLTWGFTDGTGKKGVKTIFELRAGFNQDLVAPAVHPDGYDYTWINPPDGGFTELPKPLLLLWRHWGAVLPRLEASCPWATPPEPPTRKNATPYEGESVITAFNDAHDVRALLEQHDYKPNRNKSRYLAPFSSSGLAGVVVFDDGQACYSHHGSDPLADEHPHDAFDLYRILDHDGDTKDAVKGAAKLLGMKPQGRKAKATVTPINQQAQPTAEHIPSWRDALTRTEKGALHCSVANIYKILAFDERWKGVVAWDEFCMKTKKLKLPPYNKASLGDWSDKDDTRTAIWLSDTYYFRPSTNTVLEAVEVVADDHVFHPVRQYLEGLVWDQKPRVSTWLHRYMGALDTPYARLVGRCWLVGAVARVMQPGCKMDNVLILEGVQGKGKSTVLGILAGDWFIDTPFEIGSTDGYLAMGGKWIVELAELDNFTRADSSRAKQFFAASQDTYRPPYGRRALDVKRQCVFSGSTNGNEYLKDDSGNRRYWPVLTGALDHEAVRRDRDQIWAEALLLYQGGEQWWIEANIDYVVLEQNDRYSDDAWAPLVEEYVNQRLREWESH